MKWITAVISSGRIDAAGFDPEQLSQTDDEDVEVDSDGEARFSMKWLAPETFGRQADSAGLF